VRAFGFDVGTMGYSYWDLVKLPWPEAQGPFGALKTLHLCQERAWLDFNAAVVFACCGKIRMGLL
jgi:hypothetical protein